MDHKYYGLIFMGISLLVTVIIAVGLKSMYPDSSIRLSESPSSIDDDNACPALEMICTDGTYRERNPDCSWKDCPDLVVCQSHNECPKDFNCYKFPIKNNPVCYKSNELVRCEENCGSKECNFIESDPFQIICNE